MLLRINGEPVPEEPGFFENAVDKINEFADWVIGKEVDFIVEPVVSGAEAVAEKLVEKAGEGIMALIGLLNEWSAEIITLGVVGCAFGFMLSPIWNGGATKWSGRLFVTLLLGVIWRMLIL